MIEFMSFTLSSGRTLQLNWFYALASLSWQLGVPDDDARSWEAMMARLVSADEMPVLVRQRGFVDRVFQRPLDAKSKLELFERRPDWQRQFTTLIAGLTSGPVQPLPDRYSALALCWFVPLLEGQSIRELVADVVKHLQWETHARDFNVSW